MSFQLKENKKEIKDAIQRQDVTFSSFILQACEYALNNMDSEKSSFTNVRGNSIINTFDFKYCHNEIKLIILEKSCTIYLDSYISKDMCVFSYVYRCVFFNSIEVFATAELLPGLSIFCKIRI